MRAWCQFIWSVISLKVVSIRLRHSATIFCRIEGMLARWPWQAGRAWGVKAAKLALNYLQQVRGGGAAGLACALRRSTMQAGDAAAGV